MTISTDEIITYDKLFESCRSISKSQKNKVLLSRYQAWLFRKKLRLMCKQPQRHPRALFEILELGFNLSLTVITAPKLISLAYFHDVDEAGFNRVSFEEYNKKILVTFNPKNPL